MVVMHVKRTIWLIFLLLVGSGSILYGWLFHTATVKVEKERQISIAVPTLSDLDPSPFERHTAAAPRPSDGADPFHGQSAAENSEGNPFETPPVLPNPPGMKMEKVTEKYFDDFIAPEYAIIRDVTVGGIVRLANGELKRTYSGKAPSLCPS